MGLSIKQQRGGKALVFMQGMAAGALMILLIQEAAPRADLVDIYHRYNSITMYEDGSAEGEDRSGKRFSVCIRQALCDK